MIDGMRLAMAIAVALAYATMCAWFLRPMGRRKTSAPPQDSEATLIAYASQTGFAEQLATQTANSLRSVGMPVQIASTRQLDAQSLTRVQRALFIVSTTGEGDAPDPAAGFVRSVLDRAIDLPDLRYGVLALGDRKYANFCAFGHRLDTWLRRQGATPLFDVVEVNNGDEAHCATGSINSVCSARAPTCPIGRRRAMNAGDSSSAIC